MGGQFRVQNQSRACDAGDGLVEEMEIGGRGWGTVAGSLQDSRQALTHIPRGPCTCLGVWMGGIVGDGG